MLCRAGGPARVIALRSARPAHADAKTGGSAWPTAEQRGPRASSRPGSSGSAQSLLSFRPLLQVAQARAQEASEPRLERREVALAGVVTSSAGVVSTSAAFRAAVRVRRGGKRGARRASAEAGGRRASASGGEPRRARTLARRPPCRVPHAATHALCDKIEFRECGSKERTRLIYRINKTPRGAGTRGAPTIFQNGGGGAQAAAEGVVGVRAGGRARRLRPCPDHPIEARRPLERGSGPAFPSPPVAVDAVWAAVVPARLHDRYWS